MDPAPLSPADTARHHLGRLIGRLPVGTVPTEVVDGIAGAMATWPAWPMVALQELIGPPGTALRSFDLGWLHRFEATTRLLGWLSGRLGGPTGGPSGVTLLVERAPMLGHRGWGTVSAGGSCRLVATADATIAVNLPRGADLESVPAWLEHPVGDDLWADIESITRTRSAAELLARAALLGLPVARVGEATSEAFSDGPGVDVDVRRPPLVIDLSSLWAGPLCGWYLARAGADVLKVEATDRPDGGRNAAAGFYRRLNGDKIVRDLDLRDEAGRAELRRLVGSADIVIEASRPRALAALGIEAGREVARGAIWVSITGHGRSAAPDRVGFGDDCAAAAGLVAMVGSQQWFVGDAAADPITGATAALLALGHWYAGRSVLLDVGLAPTAALHVDGRSPHGVAWSTG